MIPQRSVFPLVIENQLMTWLHVLINTIHSANERPVSCGGYMQGFKEKILKKHQFLFPCWWWKCDCGSAIRKKYPSTRRDIRWRPPVFTAATEKHMSSVWLYKYMNRSHARYRSGPTTLLLLLLMDITANYAAAGFISRLGRPVCWQFEVCLWLAWPPGGAEAIWEAERRVKCCGRLNSCCDELKGRQPLRGLGGLWASWKKNKRESEKCRGHREQTVTGCVLSSRRGGSSSLQPLHGYFAAVSGSLCRHTRAVFSQIWLHCCSKQQFNGGAKEKKRISALWNPNTLRTLITDTHQRHFFLLTAIAANKYPHPKLCVCLGGACVSDCGRAACVLQASPHPNVSLPGRRAAVRRTSIKLAQKQRRGGGCRGGLHAETEIYTGIKQTLLFVLRFKIEEVDGS